MSKFSDLCVGDIFNTKPGRFVKTDENHAICVMSAMFPLGQTSHFLGDYEVVLLWSCILESDPAVKHLKAINADLLAACRRTLEILDAWGPERRGHTLELLHERLVKVISKAVPNPQQETTDG